jgi:hypothetical protein
MIVSQKYNMSVNNYGSYRVNNRAHVLPKESGEEFSIVTFFMMDLIDGWLRCWK